MKILKFNFKKPIHLYDSYEDMEKQFSKDVERNGKEFERIISRNFNLCRPWDQAALVAIMTNLLAYVTIHAKDNGVDLEYAIMDNYDECLEKYLEKAKKGKLRV